VSKQQTGLLTDVPGLAVGHARDAAIGTGTTVILPDSRAVAGVDVRGGGPGTRETDACAPETLSDEVDAIVLSGGSAYGLEAASAVTNWLGARGRGFRFPSLKIVAPIVPAAILFDLANGGDKAWGEKPPYARLGRDACEQATFGTFPLGNVGAGYGATAGQLKGGLGSASASLDDGTVIGALVAVNAVGSVLMPGTDCFWAWPFEQNNEFGGKQPPQGPMTLTDPMVETKAAARGPGQNTSIGVVATNARLTPADAKRIAIMAQDGLARAIRPVHTPMDGDTLFTLSTCTDEMAKESDYFAVAKIGAVAADCVARAVARGVYEAESLWQTPSYRSQYGP